MTEVRLSFFSGSLLTITLAAFVGLIIYLAHLRRSKRRKLQGGDSVIQWALKVLSEIPLEQWTTGQNFMDRMACAQGHMFREMAPIKNSAWTIGALYPTTDQDGPALIAARVRVKRVTALVREFSQKEFGLSLDLFEFNDGVPNLPLEYRILLSPRARVTAILRKMISKGY